MGEFRQFLEDHGITSQLAAPGQLQQNDVAEKKNRTILEMVRTMMSYVSLPVLLGICTRNNTIHSELGSL